jgi:hypothetical protein
MGENRISVRRRKGRVEEGGGPANTWRPSTWRTSENPPLQSSGGFSRHLPPKSLLLGIVGRLLTVKSGRPTVPHTPA